MIPKRLSITHSPELCRKLEENPPTVGMLTAFGYAAALWMEVCEGGISDLHPLSTSLKGYLVDLRLCRRITMFHRTENAPECVLSVLLVRGYQYLGTSVPCSFEYEVKFVEKTGKILRESFKL